MEPIESWCRCLGINGVIELELTFSLKPPHNTHENIMRILEVSMAAVNSEIELIESEVPVTES